jgi:mono/diheme cytochrome c family protein
VFKRSNIVVISMLAVLTLFAIAGCVEAEPNPFGTTTPVPATTESGASGGGDTANSGPDLANGEKVFSNFGCSGCHNTSTDKLIGPGLAGIGSNGEDYVRESIIDPGAVIADGFNDLMPKSFKSQIKEADLDDLIAYLETL